MTPPLQGLSAVRVRYAPSPTGYLHIGGARTALYNYLLARQTGGQFILRIEDTDRERFVPDAVDEQMNGLRWLGLRWDEGPDVGGPRGPYVQSQRAEIHRAHAEQLVAAGRAYYCFCSKERLERLRREQQARRTPPRYDGLCRGLAPAEAAARRAAGEPAVVRFRAPQEGATIVRDSIRGEIRVDNSTLDDFIILKSDGLSLYHLAAMVDDHLMGVTHVIRGSEWLPSLPKHALILRAFGWEEPVWCHLSVFLKPTGKGKMSKRDAAELKEAEGHSIFVRELRALGYLPEAVLNWLALMGWSYDDHTEFFSLADLIRSFSLERVNPSPAAVNFDKLDHFNGAYIRRLDDAQLAERIRPFFHQAGLSADEAGLRRIAPIIRERITTLEQAVSMAGFFFRAEVAPDPATLVGKNMTPQASHDAIVSAHRALASLPAFDHASLEPPMRALAEELGLKAGQLFGILRAAVTGQTVSPPLFETMEIVGKEKVLARLSRASQVLQAQSLP